jgi:O-antigen/teichoic acid export membrane protein
VQTTNRPQDTVPINYGKELIGDMIRYLPVKLFPAITGLLTILILTRSLSPEQYGTYAVVMTTALLVTQLSGTWLSNAVLYLFPDYYENDSDNFKQIALKVQLLASIPAVLTGYFAVLVVTQQSVLAFVGVLLIAMQLFQSLMMTFLQSERKINNQSILLAIQSLVQLLSVSLLLFVDRDKVVYALLSIISGYIIVNFIFFVRIGLSANLKKIKTNNLHFRKIAGELFRYGLPLCIWFFATQLYTVGDRILLKFFGINYELGQYASFRDLSTGLAGFITMPLLLASHPIIMMMWKKGIEKREIEKLISHNINLLTLFFVPILVIIDICGRDLISRVLGDKYVLSTDLMLLVLVSIYIGCVAIYVQKGLEVNGNTAAMAKIALLTAILSLIGNFLFMPVYGVNGAAVIVLISQFLYLVLVRLATIRHLRPQISIKLVSKIIIWVLIVEVVCRSFETFLIKTNFSLPLFYYQLLFITLATCGLFVLSRQLLQSFTREILDVIRIRNL